MKKITEVSELAGITKRTLQYYDDKELIMAKRSDSNHRLYDEELLERLWQLLCYREMGLKLNEITAIMQMTDDDRKDMLTKKIGHMMESRARLDQLICFAETVKEYGMPPVCCCEEDNITYVECIKIIRDLICSSNINEYKAQNKDQYDTDVLDIIIESVSKYKTNK